MANEAFQRFRPAFQQNAYRQSLQRMSPFTRHGLELEPEAGFQNWLSAIQPSQTARFALQNQSRDIHARFLAQMFNNPTSSLDFVSFLGSLNPALEMAKLAPQQRNERVSGYVTPLRWVGGF